MIDKQIEIVHSRSARLYLQRQQLQLTLQEVQLQIQQIEIQMMKLDGELEILEQFKLEQRQEQEKENGE